jgi:hypothetical protein
MLERKTWDEFRKTGLLFIVNQLLHAFGWVIVFESYNDGQLDVYPARTKWRGFTEEAQTDGYKKVTVYMNENAGKLMEDVK